MHVLCSVVYPTYMSCVHMHTIIDLPLERYERVSLHMHTQSQVCYPLSGQETRCIAEGDLGVGRGDLAIAMGRIVHRASEHRASNIGGRAIRLTMGRWMRCAAVHGAQSHSLRLTGAPSAPASTHIHLHLHLTDGIDRARAILLRSFARVR